MVGLKVVTTAGKMVQRSGGLKEPIMAAVLVARRVVMSVVEWGIHWEWSWVATTVGTRADKWAPLTAAQWAVSWVASSDVLMAESTVGSWESPMAGQKAVVTAEQKAEWKAYNLAVE